MNGITNSSRKKTAYNVFYSTLCAELKTESHADQRIIMGDDLLRPFQQQLIADDLAAQADADDDLDADDLAEAEDDDDDDDDDDGHRYDAYFDIRVKRRMVRLVQVVCSFFLFVSILFPLIYYSTNILVEYNLEKFVSDEERYVAGESPPVE